jgi:hypothetical protein
MVRPLAKQGHRALPDGPLRQKDLRQQRVQTHDPRTSQQSGKKLLSCFTLAFYLLSIVKFNIPVS